MSNRPTPPPTNPDHDRDLGPDIVFDPEADAKAVLDQKLRDAMIPGFEVEFDPDEAERAGAFVEDALSEADARDGAIDLLDTD